MIAPHSVSTTTTNGRVRGSVADGIATFLAVPYAAPPFGDRRFRAPEPPERWTDERDCTDLGSTAPAPAYRAVVRDLLAEPVIEGEDCLHVNVWSPDVSGHAPVFVWIHGGSFQNGSNAVPAYDGSTFARDGVVAVGVNYRLGVDGFAHLPDAPDNRGLLDQIAALEWVRDNIGSFGGDPAQVTIAGESAGAMSVVTLTAMPAARGLFRRVIAQSGAGHHAITPATATLISAELCSILDVPVTAEALAQVGVPQLIAAHDELVVRVGKDPDPVRWGEVAANMMPFEPVVDGESLPALPLRVIAAGDGADVELLIGHNDDEHALFLYPLLDLISEAQVRAVIGAHRAAAGAYELYVAHARSERPGDVMVAALTDWFFRLPALRLVEARAQLGEPSYVYEFGWRSPMLGGALGAAHAMEIGFVFDCLAEATGYPMVGDAAQDPAAQGIATAMHAAWVAFVRDGDPGWSPYGRERLTRRFGGRDDGAVVADPDPERRLAWPHR